MRQEIHLSEVCFKMLSMWTINIQKCEEKLTSDYLA